MAAIAREYREWARVEGHGSSPTYERLALEVADSSATLELLATLDPLKRQPNLLFAALRLHELPVDDPRRAIAMLGQDAKPVLDTMRRRRTQTNEVRRCAALLPALALLPQPLALIECGASAGLCLLYDRWRYHYVGGPVDHWVGDAASEVTLTCRVDADVPLPAAVPRIVWRAGIDLNPIDPCDPEQRRWLQCLVWPEHAERARILAAALDVAATEPPRIVAGDIVERLPALLDEAPRDATVVVLHSAALVYMPPEHRQDVVSMLRHRGVHRLGAEADGVVPGVAATGVEGEFVISLDDDVLGFAAPHGDRLRWKSR